MVYKPSFIWGGVGSSLFKLVDGKYIGRCPVSFFSLIKKNQYLDDDVDVVGLRLFSIGNRSVVVQINITSKRKCLFLQHPEQVWQGRSLL